MKRQFAFSCMYALFSLWFLSSIEVMSTLDDPGEWATPFPVTAPSVNMGGASSIEVDKSYSSSCKRPPSDMPDMIESSPDWPYPPMKKKGNSGEEIVFLTDYHEATAAGGVLSRVSGMLDDGDWDNPFKSRSETEGRDGGSLSDFEEETSSDMWSGGSEANSESDYEEKELSTKQTNFKDITDKISDFLDEKPDFLTIREWKEKFFSEGIIPEKKISHTLECAIWRLVKKKEMLKETDKWLDSLDSAYVSKEIIDFIERNPQFLTIGECREKLLQHNLITKEQSSLPSFRAALRNSLKKRGLLKKSKKMVRGTNSKYITKEIIEFVDQNPEVLNIGEWREKFVRNNLMSKEQLLDPKVNTPLRRFLEPRNVLKVGRRVLGMHSKYITPTLREFVDKNHEVLDIEGWRRKLLDYHITTPEQLLVPSFNEALRDFLTSCNALKIKKRIPIINQEEACAASDQAPQETIIDWLQDWPLPETAESYLGDMHSVDGTMGMLSAKEGLSQDGNKAHALEEGDEEYLSEASCSDSENEAEDENPPPKKSTKSKYITREILLFVEQNIKFSSLSDWKKRLVENKIITEKQLLDQKFRKAIEKFLNKRGLLVETKSNEITPIERMKNEILKKKDQMPEKWTGLTIEEWRQLVVERGIFDKETLMTSKLNDILRKFLKKEDLLKTMKQVRLISEEVKTKILAEVTHMPLGFKGLFMQDWEHLLVEKNIIDKKDLVPNFSQALKSFLRTEDLLQEIEKPQYISPGISAFVQKNSERLTLDEWITLLLDNQVIGQETLTPEFKKVFKFYLETKKLPVLDPKA